MPSKSLFALLLLCASALDAQSVIPPPTEHFRGVVTPNVADSRQAYPETPRAPKGAPNVLLILLDDVGFAYAEGFGGEVPMPALDRLAQNGLRYTRFHTAAVCSPTRAALLTGRNHHNVGTAYVMEGGGLGFPGQNTVWPKSAASIAEILKGHGYNTAAFGKWHNVPIWETSQAGPFDRWPTGQGFEYFYGFLGGDTNQWMPALIENTRPIEPPYERRDYHFTTDMTDQAIKWMRAQHSIAPDKPFFMYYAPGATHAPHQAPREWIEKFRGRFDDGWDRYREETFARQKALGIIPADARLTRRPPEIPAWASLSPQEKKIAARMMEVYAAFLAHTDHEIERLLQAMQDSGVAGNTLVAYIVGDNGASGEGGLHGSSVEMKAVSGIPERIEDILPRLDELGGPNTYQVYPVGWAWAGSTPFQWVKRVASHFGSMRNPLVVSWPGHIGDPGGIRTQFHHVIDVVPTLLEVIGLQTPSMVNGVAQQPMDGISMAYTFAATGKTAADRRETQYFEVEGNKGIYHKGWFASNRVVLPWDFSNKPSALGATWELYNIDKDFSQADDLAARMPDKLHEMQNLWWTEAARNQVLPVVTRAERVATPKQVPTVPRTDKKRYVYYPGTVRLPETVAAPVQFSAHSITADLRLPPQGAQGVIVAEGGRFGGFSFFVQNKRLAYTYNWYSQERYAVVSDRELPSGEVRVRYEFSCDSTCRPGDGGTGRIFIGEDLVGQMKIQKTVKRLFSLDETFDVGQDTGTPATEDYATPFSFTGEVQRVTVEMK